jgi:hypothetical protein
LKIVRFAVVGVMLGAATPVYAFDLAEFFGFKKPLVTHERPGSVEALISNKVREKLGARWVPTALKIAKIESGGRCNAYNRGAIGVFQVRHPERFGVSSRAARTCAGGVEAGVAHMRSCLDRGATTPRSMFICHNAGSPFVRVRRLEPAYRRLLAALG